MKLYLGIAWFCLFLLLALVGCSDEDERRQERREGDRQGPVVIGPGDRYDTHSSRTDRGDREEREGRERDEREGRRGGEYDRVRDVQMTGYRVRPASSPVLDRFDLAMQGVHIQHSPIHITNPGTSTFTARATEGDINTFLNGRAHRGNLGVRNIHMAFSKQQVQTTALVMMNNREVTAVSTGTLRPDGGTRIIYVPATIMVGDTALPAAAQQDILQQINPVIDLQSLPCAPQLKNVTLGKGEVMLSGTATPKNLP
ncbi:MAG TPA: LmeA family phospholipid-binding protein [Armatimonadota bacterium]